MRLLVRILSDQWPIEHADTVGAVVQWVALQLLSDP